jgi:2'-5' RNA ligase
VAREGRSGRAKELWCSTGTAVPCHWNATGGVAAYRGGMRTVELVCGAALDGAVRDCWARLYAAGLPSLATHSHPTNRPHLTLATAEEFPPGAWERIAAALTALPIEIRADKLVFFGGAQAMAAWRVVADSVLWEVQAAVWSALDGAQRNPLHEPGRWVPHISVARRVHAEQRPVVERVAGAAVRGALVAGRSYDSVSRTVTDL